MQLTCFLGLVWPGPLRPFTTPAMEMTLTSTLEGEFLLFAVINHPVENESGDKIGL